MITGAGHTRRARRVGKIAAVAVVLCASVLLAPAPVEAGSGFHNTRIWAGSSGGAVWSLKLDLKGRVISRQRVEGASRPVLWKPGLVQVFAGHVLVNGSTGDKDPAAPTVWILNSAGHLRPVTNGTAEGFSPGGTAVLFTRTVERDGPINPFVEQVFLRNLASGKETLLFEAGGNCYGGSGAHAFQMSSDHRFIWMNEFCIDGSNNEVFSFADHKIHGYTNPKGILACGDTQLLPGGTTVLSLCDHVYAKPQVHRFVVSRISNGKTLRQVPQNMKLMVLDVGGLLDKTHALATVQTSTRHYALGRLDLKTLKVQVIPHTAGLGNAVTEFN